MITDAYFNSRLWVFRNKGHRLSALVEVDRAIAAVHSEFLVNSFDDAQLYVVQATTGNQLAIYSYNCEKNMIKTGKMSIEQIIEEPETIQRLLKIPTGIPVPAPKGTDSSLAVVCVGAEGGIKELIPLPRDVFSIIGSASGILRLKSFPTFYNGDQITGQYLTNDWAKVDDITKTCILGKIKACRGAW